MNLSQKGVRIMGFIHKVCNVKNSMQFCLISPTPCIMKVPNSFDMIIGLIFKASYHCYFYHEILVKLHVMPNILKAILSLSTPYTNKAFIFSS